MGWYRTSAGANGVNSYVNELGTVLSVTGTSPNFTLSLGSTVLAGGPYATAAAAEVQLLKVIDADERMSVIDPSIL